MIDKQNKFLDIKVVQVGDNFTGKTSLLQKYHTGVFENNFYSIQTSFYQKILEIVSQIYINGSQKIKFYFWDFQSGERNKRIPPIYYRESRIIMIIYDITNRQSFEKVQFFLKDIFELQSSSKFLLALIGNKCDLEGQRQIQKEEGQQLADSLGMLFFEVSAKSGYQVNQLYEQLINMAININ